MPLMVKNKISLMIIFMFDSNGGINYCNDAAYYFSEIILT